MFYRQTGWRDEQPLAMTGLDEHGLSELALKIAVCLLGMRDSISQSTCAAEGLWNYQKHRT